MIRLLRRLLWVATILFAILLGAELAARMDDRVRYGVPLTAEPNENRDLVVADSTGWHGRPYGRYKQWQLDRFGFRSPDIALTPPPGCKRVVVMGASETFGLYESDSMEYPAQLQRLLAKDGCYQVVNAAIVGFSVPALTQLWNSWVSRFKPDVVVVYPSPVFYLADRIPHYRLIPKRSIRSDPSRWWFPRLVDRAHDEFHWPDVIQRHRVKRGLDSYDATHASDSLFAAVPSARLQAFYCDLDSLVTTIDNNGAQPVLVTHATRFSNPPMAEDSAMLSAWRQFTPRATTAVLVSFEAAARASVIELGQQRDVPVVDAAAVLGGHRMWFGDFVHFTDEGASIMADLLEARIRRLPGRIAPAHPPSAACGRPKLEAARGELFRSAPKDKTSTRRSGTTSPPSGTTSRAPSAP